ncbi:uncharacterized protein CCR75_003330 [Bremia lactucae]|uniref:Uncharacterized protein n=1 Tax=Bremia lactucae TaxID=4779 RepID=A0A976NZK1_BRELC|nr:hypothetical protein CCR75_003330 [Bremia lactucae]
MVVETAIVISGIGKEINDEMLKKMYCAYGPIARVKHNGSNSAQVVFTSKKDALKATRATNGAIVHGKTLKVTFQRKFKQSTEPCRGFVAGICRKGDMCKYYHVTDDATYARSSTPAVATTVHEPTIAIPKIKTFTPNAPVIATTVREPTIAIPKIKTSKPLAPDAAVSEALDVPPTQLCHYFTRGFCAKGHSCTYAHVLGLAKNPDQGKIAMLCQYFGSGKCSRGDTCRFIHQPNAAPASEKENVITEVIQSKGECESDSSDENNSDMRTCLECEKPQVAVWKCAMCNDALYCDDCNVMVHKARVMRKHERIKLPPIPTAPACGECESSVASVQCMQCGVPFCASCDASVHKFRSLRQHNRINVADLPEQKNAPQKAEKKLKESTRVINIATPVPYVESIPQLEFSSESSESEDEETQSFNGQTALENEGDTMADMTGSESEDDLNDVNTKGSSAGIHSEDESAARTPQLEQSSDSDSSDDEASSPIKNFSSESEDESQDEALAKKTGQKSAKSCSVMKDGLDNRSSFKPVLKQSKKSTKTASASKKQVFSSSSSSSSSDASESSNHEAPASAKRTRTTHPAPGRNYKAGGISDGNSHTIVKKIEAFNDSSSSDELHLNASLNGFERLLAHDCAERLGLGHESVGDGLDRHIIISRSNAKRADSSQIRKAKKSKRSKP